MDKSLIDLKERLLDEIKSTLKKPTLGTADLDALCKAVDILKDISMMDQDGGYSQYSPMYHDEGNSYRRGRNQRNGQYMSRDNMPYSQYSQYGSYDGNYSGNPSMIETLRHAMQSAQTDDERRAVQDLINRIER